MRVKLEDIIRRAFRMADVPVPDENRSDQYVDLVEAVDEANAGLAELHDLLVEKWIDWLTKTATVTMTVGQQTTLLPSDFLALREIFIIDSGNQRHPLDEFRLDEMAGSTTTATDSYPDYRIMNTHLYWHPLPSGARSVELWYVRAFDVLEDLNDEISPELPAGWEEYVVGHLAEYIIDKAERNSTTGAKAKARAERRITTLASNRNASGPRKTPDVSGRFARRRRYPYPKV